MVIVYLILQPAQMVDVSHLYHPVQMVVVYLNLQPAQMVGVDLSKDVLELRVIGKPIIMKLEGRNGMKLGINYRSYLQKSII
jgi:hypothetical protein